MLCNIMDLIPLFLLPVGSFGLWLAVVCGFVVAFGFLVLLHIIK